MISQVRLGNAINCFECIMPSVAGKFSKCLQCSDRSVPRREHHSYVSLVHEGAAKSTALPQDSQFVETCAFGV